MFCKFRYLTQFECFAIFLVCKEIVESDTFFGGLGKGWLEEGLKEEIVGNQWYFLSLSFSQIFFLSPKNII